MSLFDEDDAYSILKTEVSSQTSEFVGETESDSIANISSVTKQVTGEKARSFVKHDDGIITAKTEHYTVDFIPEEHLGGEKDE